MASTITPERIADLIDHAPAWAKIGLTVPSDRLRQDARRELAEHVYSSLFKPAPLEGQLALPL